MAVGLWGQHRAEEENEGVGSGACVGGEAWAIAWISCFPLPRVLFSD